MVSNSFRGRRPLALLLTLAVTGLAGIGLAGVLLGGVNQAHADTNGAAYDEVLASPDNLAVNVRFLEVQLANGDFEGASITLQRILLINSNFDEARLIRVAVFLRLGDHLGAAADLAYLEGQPLSLEDRAQADRLAEHVQPDSSAPGLSGVVRFGALYDSNAGQSPGAGNLIGVNSFSFPTNGRFGAFGELQFVGDVPFGGGDGHALRVEGHGFARVHTDGSSAHSYARLAVGPRFDLGFAFFDLMAVGGLELIGSHVYGTSLGGRAELIVDVSDVVAANLRVEAVHDSVDVSLQTAPNNAGDGDGLEVSVRPSVTYRVNNLWSLVAHGLYVNKDAGSGWFSYSAFGGGLAAQYRDAAGYRFRLAASVQDVSYDTVNPSITAYATRDETRYQLEASVSAPLSEVLEVFGQNDVSGGWASDWSVETFARYSTNQSNVPIFESDTLTVGIAFARRFSM